VVVSPSEKYYSPDTVSWTVSGSAEHTVNYYWIKKGMSDTEAELCDTMTVTIDFSIPTTATGPVTIVDDLPNEMTYIKGSAIRDSIPYEPTVTLIDLPEKHQQLGFTVEGSGDHEITFDVKVTKAHEADTIVENHVQSQDMYIDVICEVNIHPYIGDTFSKDAVGPEEVSVNTKQEWVFRFIVKNNYEDLMTDPVMKDNFGAELVMNPETDIANVLTNPVFDKSKGKAEQVRVEWELPDLMVGEAYALEVTMSTGTTPSKHKQQEYTSPGVYALNSGATFKWYYLGKKQSLETDPIYVTAVNLI
jgi:uncharacterized repeat protein (TIGR01451 family)